MTSPEKADHADQLEPFAQELLSTIQANMSKKFDEVVIYGIPTERAFDSFAIEKYSGKPFVLGTRGNSGPLQGRGLYLISRCDKEVNFDLEGFYHSIKYAEFWKT